MASLAKFLFTLQINVKTYHWLTTSFARHKAADGLFEDVLRLTDTLMETFIGKYGREDLRTVVGDISLVAHDDRSIVGFLNKTALYLESLPTKQHWTADADADLLSIRDELLVKVNQTKYLFTLK